MNRNYLAFDIETAKVLPSDAGDWKSHRPLGIACAATRLNDSDETLLWHGGKHSKRPARQMNRQEAARLVNYLANQVRRGYTIVTWNGVGFDFDVLAEESGMLEKCRKLAFEHVDMMFHILCQLGYGIGLDSAARGMELAGKEEGMNGALAPRLWKEGRRNEVLKYVAHDVRITMELAEICEAQGLLRWITRRGRNRKMALPHGWLSVRLANSLPEPATTWMRGQWSRATFTHWLL
jgi:hypothetical protein